MLTLSLAYGAPFVKKFYWTRLAQKIAGDSSARGVNHWNAKRCSAVNLRAQPLLLKSLSLFFHKNFNTKLCMDTRRGTERDVANLENTAQRLGFEYVRVFNDCTKKELIDWVERGALIFLK